MDDLIKVILASKLLPQKKEWVGLTDEDINNIQQNFYTYDKDFVKAIEAKLKEKNR